MNVRMVLASSRRLELHKWLSVPLVIAIPSEIVLRFKAVVYSKEGQLEDELSCGEEYRSKIELHECENDSDILKAPGTLQVRL